MNQSNAPAFYSALDRARPPSGIFRYLEIGVCNGEGMACVQEYLRSKPGEWAMIGVDKENGQFGLESVKRALGDSVELLMSPYNAATLLPPGWVGISLHGSHEFLQKYSGTFNMVFVDGCHAEECCARDFELCEYAIEPGGVVAFHDSDPGCQGGEIQWHHCSRPMGVRRALEALGLLSNSRAGWELLTDNNDPPAGQRGIVIVRKIP